MKRIFAQSATFAVVLTIGAVAVFAGSSVTNAVSQFNVTVDGQFTGGIVNGQVAGEWSDVTPLAFHSPTSPTDTFYATTIGDPNTNALLYTALDPGLDDIYLMYDFLPRTQPCQTQEILNQTTLFSVNFPIQDPRPKATGTTIIQVLFVCSAPNQGGSPASVRRAPGAGAGGASVVRQSGSGGVATGPPCNAPVSNNLTVCVLFDDGTEVPASNLGMDAVLGFGPSTLSGTPHALAELGVPLNIPANFGVLPPENGDYNPAPAFWSGSGTGNAGGAAGGDPSATTALFQILPNGSTTANSDTIIQRVAEIAVTGVSPNVISTKDSTGGITVTVFGSSTFSVSSINAATVLLGQALQRCGASIGDVNHDGIPDATFNFEESQVGLAKNAITAILTGNLTNGTTFGGTAAITLVKDGTNQPICPATVPTSGGTCNGTYNGTFSGNITVATGQKCSFAGGMVDGNITVNGGSLTLNYSEVTKNVQFNGGGTFNLGQGATIDGNLQVQNIPAVAGVTDQICGATVDGNVQFQNNGTAVQIGSSPPSMCAGNSIGGNLQVQNNTASATIFGNTVGGNLQDQNNTGPTQVFNNTVSKNLQCEGDASITGGGNVANRKQDQCARF